MTVSARQLTRNIANITGAYVGRKMLSLIYFLFIARFMSVENTGFYFLLLSLASVFTTLLDAGLSNTLIREASRSPGSLQRYLNNTLGVKTVLSVLMILSAVFLFCLFDYSPLVKRLVLMIILMMIFTSFSDSFYACLRVHHRIVFEARAIFIGQLITLIVGGLSLWLHPSLDLLVAALVLGQMYHFFYSAMVVTRELGIQLSLSLERSVLVPSVRIAVPFLISALFGQILYADTFILKHLTTNRIVGLFSIPSSLFGALRFIPIGMEAAIFPAFSTFHVTSQEKLSRTFQAYFSTILFLVAPAATVMTIAPGEIIHLIFGPKYMESAPTLQILSLSMIPLFISQPVMRLLEACGRQVVSTLLLGASLAINMILTLILVKMYGAVGIAISCLIGYVFLLLVTMRLASKILGPVMRSCFASLARISIVVLFMGYTLYFFKAQMPIIPAVLLSGTVYFFCLIFFRGMTLQGFSRQRAYGEWIALSKWIIK